jgi:hypothetical protein
MASIREFYDHIHKAVGEMPLPQDAVGSLTSDRERAIALQFYSVALEDLKTTWQTNETWNRETFCVDFLAHQQRIKAGLEQRLGLVPASTQAMAAGGTEAPAGGGREGGPYP